MFIFFFFYMIFDLNGFCFYYHYYYFVVTVVYSWASPLSSVNRNKIAMATSPERRPMR